MVLEVLENKIKCNECMYDAPYNFCCKQECNEHEFCKNCTAKCKHEIKKCK